LSGPGPEWRWRYEALRAHATGEAPLDFVPLGLAVLWHRGVAAWMAAECSAADAGAAGDRASRPSASISGAELGAPRSQLVTLLASMALRAVPGRAS